MDINTTELRLAPNDIAEGYLACTLGSGATRNKRAENLEAEAVASGPMLPSGGRWAIRFRADGTVTLVLGMCNYGRGCFSGYFASLVAARLGVPFRRVRLYYSGNLPAALQTPLPPLTLPCRSTIGPLAAAAAHVIEGMCDQVIDRGRLAFAVLAGVGAIDVGFDQPTGRFFVLDRGRSCNSLELAARARGRSCASAEFANGISAT